MPSLFGREFSSSDTRVARGVSGGISVAVQLALGVVVVVISSAATPTTIVKSPMSRPRFVSAVFLPTPAAETPVELAPELNSPDEVKMPEPAPERSSLVAVRTFENKAVPTPAASEVRPVDVAPRPTPSVGSFSNAAAIARKSEPVKRVEVAGFDAPVASAAQSQPGPAAVGAFDAAPSPGARRMGAASDRNNAVIESGFNQASPGAQPTQHTRVIRDSGFGTSDNLERPKAQDRGTLQQTGFTDARVAEPIRRSVPEPKTPRVVPVEVLSKPTPIYTDEARRLKVEGEVVLEVEFCASGLVRIVRVVRGLGHGLDESATVAARRIQFKPATSGGRPVDYRATVQIVFRLA